jgi:hypothetical protein
MMRNIIDHRSAKININRLNRVPPPADHQIVFSYHLKAIAAIRVSPNVTIERENR